MEAGEGGGEWITGLLRLTMDYWSAYVYVELLHPVFYFYLILFLFFFSTLFSISAAVKHNHFVDEIWI